MFRRWESKAITRYLANKHNLASWYPADVKERAICDIALDFYSSAFYPLIFQKIVSPKLGWAKLSSADTEAAEKSWNDDVWPALSHLLQRSGGPLLGGAKPSIADASFLGSLVMLFGKCADSFAAKTPGLRAYFDALKAALPKHAEYLAVAEGFWNQ